MIGERWGEQTQIVGADSHGHNLTEYQALLILSKSQVGERLR